MKQYKMLAKDVLAEYANSFRKHRNLTQDEMAERLRITSRAYGDLERGKYCFSTIPLLFLLIMLNDAELKILLENFRKSVCELEHKDAA